MDSTEPPQRQRTYVVSTARLRTYILFIGISSGLSAIAANGETNSIPATFHFIEESSKSPYGLVLLFSFFIASIFLQNRHQATLSSSLKKETQQVQGLLDQLVGEHHDGVWAQSGLGELLYVNAALQKMFGNDPRDGIADDLQVQWRRCIHPHDLVIFDQGENTLQKKGYREIHYRLALPGQSVRWIEDRASVIRNENSSAKTIGFLTDITERKSHEQKISSLSRYLGIISQTNQAIIRCKNASSLFKDVCELLTQQGGFAASWIFAKATHKDGASLGAATLVASSNTPQALLMQMNWVSASSVSQSERELLAEIRLENDFLPRVRSIESIGIDGVLPLLGRYFTDGSNIVSFPLRLGGEMVATISLITHPGDHINDEAMVLLYGLAVDISFALDIYAKDSIRRKTEDELRLAAKVFESNREGIIITDSAKRILSVNRAFTEVTGYSAQEAINMNPSMLSSGRQDGTFYRQMWATLERQGFWQGEIWNRRKSGEVYPELLAISEVTATDGKTTHYIGVFSDITERKIDQDRLEFLAHHDALTGLPNRILLRDRVDMAVTNARRSGKRAALIFLDLDNFKAVNDSLGHQVGDQLLVALVKQISTCLRETDTLSRLGGDEFVAVINELHDQEDAAIVARKILAAVEAPLSLESQAITVAFSIGISLCPDDGNDFDTLLRHADTAMYHAKKAGKRTYRFFEDSMNVGATEKLKLQSSLFHAVEREELRLAYQPQVEISSGKIVGTEALLRWNSLEHGSISPAKFIPIAEESGFILAIGDWVLEQACRQAREWIDAGLPPIAIAVNISALQFRRGNLICRVRALLGIYDLPPGTLELEITESTMVQDDDLVLQTVLALKDMGVLFSIDDFGTGYSNLGYLRKFNADKLKIDKSFVHAMANNSDEELLVQAIIQMARNLKLKTIAEGVETQEQLDQLTTMGCDEIQGYFFSQPVQPEQFSELLSQYNSN